jgi:hypothetical protein
MDKKLESRLEHAKLIAAQLGTVDGIEVVVEGQLVPLQLALELAEERAL